MKPFSQACENNKAAILEILRREFAAVRRVLEIGSGTGQHAAHFVPALPWLRWQCSDRAENLPGIRAWLAELDSGTYQPAIELDVCASPWPCTDFDAVYSANTAHIMHWQTVEQMFHALGEQLRGPIDFALYGPFMVDGRHTAPSNAAFDQWLRRQDPGQGVRDLAALDELAAAQGLQQAARYHMPANNQLVIWRRR